jgi:hypothetical protein
VEGAAPANPNLPLPYVQNGHLNPTHLAGNPARTSSAVYSFPIRGTVGSINPGSRSGSPAIQHSPGGDFRERRAWPSSSNEQRRRG